MKRINLLILLLSICTVIVTTQSCQKDDPDPCETVVCNNGGTCNEGTCECLTGYEGLDCSEEVRDKFEGSWTYTDSCLPGNNTNSTIGESLDDILKVTISNILGSDLGGAAIADIDGNTIIINSQTVVDSDGDSWTVSSTSGALSDSSFTLNITFTFGSANQTCDFTFTR